MVSAPAFTTLLLLESYMRNELAKLKIQMKKAIVPDVSDISRHAVHGVQGGEEAGRQPKRASRSPARKQ